MANCHNSNDNGEKHFVEETRKKDFLGKNHDLRLLINRDFARFNCLLNAIFIVFIYFLDS